jgi:hypothetical protein
MSVTALRGVFRRVAAALKGVAAGFAPIVVEEEE